VNSRMKTRFLRITGVPYPDAFWQRAKTFRKATGAETVANFLARVSVRRLADHKRLYGDEYMRVVTRKASARLGLERFK